MMHDILYVQMLTSIQINCIHLQTCICFLGLFATSILFKLSGIAAAHETVIRILTNLK